MHLVWCGVTQVAFRLQTAARVIDGGCRVAPTLRTCRPGRPLAADIRRGTGTLVPSASAVDRHRPATLSSRDVASRAPLLCVQKLER
jgi:hypothetical protein